MLTETTSKINVTDHNNHNDHTEPFNHNDVELTNNENSALNDHQHHDRTDDADRNENDVRIEELDKTIDEKEDNVIIRNMTELDCNDEEDDDQTYEIIDGIMFMNFDNEHDLNEFTINDERLRKKNEEKKLNRLKKSTNANRNSTSSSTANRKKSTSPAKQLDSAFVSSELDDYLNSRKGNRYSNIDLENSFNSSFKSTSGKSITNKRKSTNDVRYSQGLNETDLNSSYSNVNGFLDSDSSLYQSFNASLNGSTSKNTNYRKLLNSNLNKTHSNKSTSKSKNKKPEMIVLNQIDQELKDTKEFDSAYLKCLTLVKKTYDYNREKMKTKFRAVKLNECLCRSALSTLHPNSHSNIPDTTDNDDLNLDIVNSVNKNSKKINTDKKVNKQSANESTVVNEPNGLRNDLENSLINNCDKSNNLIKSELETFDRSIKPLDLIEKKVKKKIKNESNEEEYDITRIISKHSKRDIRLPARYHESGILVGSQWILPNFEEHKNRIVNTGTGKKQSSTGKLTKKLSTTKLTDKNESSKIALNSSKDLSSLSFSTLNSSADFNSKTNKHQAFDQPSLNPDDLMTEDEDNNTTSPTPNDSSNLINNSLVNDKSTISINKLPNKKNQMKEKKIVMLRDMYRQLFYANKPQRKDYYASISIKPRVNKSEVLQEGVDTINAMTTQKKCLNHANNLLITWNNKLKICLSTLEQHSKGLGAIDLKEFNSMEKLVNTYRNNILKKVNQEITTGNII